MFALAARTGWGLQLAEDLLEPGPDVTALGGRILNNHSLLQIIINDKRYTHVVIENCHLGQIK